MNSPFRLGVLLTVLLLGVSAASAQSSEKISDAERAKRDADKVFSFIKFHTVKPAAAPKPATPPSPAVSRAAPPVAAAAVAASPRPLPPAAVASISANTAASAAVAPASNVAAAAPAASAPTPAGTASAPPVAAALEDAPPVQASLPPTANPPAPVTQPEAAAPVEEEEEVPLKLIAYTAPEMSAQVMAAMDRPKVVVPVRFTVQADGRVSAARATGNAPRRIELAAVRAVLQWRFEPLPALREVDVEIAFNATE